MTHGASCIASTPPDQLGGVLVEVGEGDGLAARPTDAAVQRVFDDHGVDDLVRARPIEADDVWPQLGVLATGPASAETAGAKGGLFTGPAVHAWGSSKSEWGAGRKGSVWEGHGARGGR